MIRVQYDQFSHTCLKHGRPLKETRKKLACVERRVLKIIEVSYDPILENKKHRRRTDGELQQMYRKFGFNACLMSKRTEWTGRYGGNTRFRRKLWKKRSVANDQGLPETAPSGQVQR